jgi:hypothetical protein
MPLQTSSRILRSLGPISSQYGSLTVAINPKTFGFGKVDIVVTSNAIQPTAAADVQVSCFLGEGVPSYFKAFPATVLGSMISLTDVPYPARCITSALTYAAAPEGFVCARNANGEFTAKDLATPTRAMILIEALSARRISVTSTTEGGPLGELRYSLNIGCNLTKESGQIFEFPSGVFGPTDGSLRSTLSILVGAQCESSRLTYESIPAGYIPLFPAFQDRTFAFDWYAADVLPKFTVTSNDPLQFTLTHRLAKADAQVRVRWEPLPGSVSIVYDPRVSGGATCRTLQRLPGNLMTPPRESAINLGNGDLSIAGAVIGESCALRSGGPALPQGYAWAPRVFETEVVIARALDEITIRALLYSHAAAKVEFRVVGQNIPNRYSGFGELSCEKLNQVVFSTSVSFNNGRLEEEFPALPHEARCSLKKIRLSDSETAQTLVIEKAIAPVLTPVTGADWNITFNIQATAFSAESAANAVPTLSKVGTLVLIGLLALSFRFCSSHS